MRNGLLTKNLTDPDTVDPDTVASDEDYQLLAHGRWFSPGTPASSTTKIGRHEIAEILLKVALNIKIKSNQFLPKHNFNNMKFVLYCVICFQSF